MLIQQLAISGYRSIREIELRLGPVNLIVGPNGSGKSNLYRSLYLLKRAADGTLALALAEEGGMPSALWAGARRKGPVRLRIAVSMELIEYEIELGLPTPDGTTLFQLDPLVKSERAWLWAGGRRIGILERTNSVATLRDADGNRQVHPQKLSPSESVLSELREPARYPILASIRQQFQEWRFYHQFRTDAASPVRQPQIGVRTPQLADDGRDLAAALQTINEIGEPGLLDAVIDKAFPGAALEIDSDRQSLTLGLKMPGFIRPFSQPELSDGTLHYLCLAAALLSPRPPALIALNEPETSIHPDLYPAIADLIARAARSSQLWITTHSEALAQLTAKAAPTELFQLHKHQGETRLTGHGLLGPVEPDPPDA